MLDFIMQCGLHNILTVDIKRSILSRNILICAFRNKLYRELGFEATAASEDAQLSCANNHLTPWIQ